MSRIGDSIKNAMERLPNRKRSAGAPGSDLGVSRTSHNLAVAADVAGKLGSAGQGGVLWIAKTITAAGWLCVALALAWLPIGVGLHWVEFELAGFAAFILLLVAVPFLFGGRNYRVEFDLPSDHVTAGDDINTSISVTNEAPRIELPGRIEIPFGPEVREIGVPLLGSGKAYQEKIVFEDLKRGVLKIGPLKSVRTDPLSLFRNEHEENRAKTLWVHPRIVTVSGTKTGLLKDLEGTPSSKLVDSDTSFHAIREYRSGDSMRHIHWKSTARQTTTGKFMVRQFEESRRSRMTLILASQTKEYASAEEFELAVSAMGSLGVRAIYDGRTMSAVVSEQNPALKNRALSQLRSTSRNRLLDSLCDVNLSDQAKDLSSVCQLVDHTFKDISVAIIFCGSKTSERDLQRIRLRLPSEIGVLAVTCQLGTEATFRSKTGIKIMNIGKLEDLRGMMSRFTL